MMDLIEYLKIREYQLTHHNTRKKESPRDFYIRVGKYLLKKIDGGLDGVILYYFEGSFRRELYVRPIIVQVKANNSYFSKPLEFWNIIKGKIYSDINRRIGSYRLIPAGYFDDPVKVEVNPESKTVTYYLSSNIKINWEYLGLVQEDKNRY